MEEEEEEGGPAALLSLLFLFLEFKKRRKRERKFVLQREEKIGPHAPWKWILLDEKFDRFGGSWLVWEKWVLNFGIERAERNEA